MEITLLRSVENNFVLEWSYKGKSNLNIDIQINDIRAVVNEQLYKFGTKVKIDSKDGRQIL